MDRSSARTDFQQNPSSTAATLTLSGPTSGSTSWTFDRDDIGKRITVGPTTSCDWQIMASGVFPVVILFTGESLWVGVEQTNRLAIRSGATLKRGWSQLHHGDRLELGGACIHIDLAPDLRTDQVAAAVVHPPSHPSHPNLQSDAPPAAIVRLVRGTSERSTWLFRTTDLGASVSLGAGRHCDWPMTTGGFEIREVTLLFAGGTLLARREQPGNRIRLDGEPMGDDWIFVGAGSRLEIGLACLELQFTTENRATLPPLPPGVRPPRQLPPQAVPLTPIVPLQAGAETLPIIAARFEPAPAYAPQQAARSPSTSSATKTKLERYDERAQLVLRGGGALAQVPHGTKTLTRQRAARIEHPRRDAVEMSKQSMEARRPPEAWVQACVPNARPSKRRTKLTGYALGGLLLAVLYAAWLLLLERF